MLTVTTAADAYALKVCSDPCQSKCLVSSKPIATQCGTCGQALLNSSSKESSIKNMKSGSEGAKRLGRRSQGSGFEVHSVCSYTAKHLRVHGLGWVLSRFEVRMARMHALYTQPHIPHDVRSVLCRPGWQC